MQDKYISLDPVNTIREEKAIRANLFKKRQIEADGTDGAGILGAQFGLTAAVLMYSSLRTKQWAFLPLRATKASGYAKIGMSFLLAASFGHSIVSTKYGNHT